jgi:hypothetical protein
MHALRILHRCVAPLLVGIHGRRLTVLLKAVAATVSGPRLTLTEIGRRFGGGSDLRHRIKRADRLLGNAHLQRDAQGISAALAKRLLTGVAEPLIVIDWSDLKEDQSLHLLRASLPVGESDHDSRWSRFQAISQEYRVLTKFQHENETAACLT